MDRLKKLLKRLETTPDVVRLSSFKPEILGDCTVGDLRQSLSQEAVRNEALDRDGLESALQEISRCHGNTPELTRMRMIARSALLSLKREPNAAGGASDD
jgi:hypothetical protein